jgi:hypothetical protein
VVQRRWLFRVIQPQHAFTQQHRIPSGTEAFLELLQYSWKHHRNHRSQYDYEADQPIFQPAIYELGYPNIGNPSYNGTWRPTTPPDYHTLPNTLDGCQQKDLNVKATLLRHGNWDAVNNAVVWDANIPDHTIPNSLYLTQRPTCWDADLAWPPIGPDLNPMVGMIPAQRRFQGGPGSYARPNPNVYGDRYRVGDCDSHFYPYGHANSHGSGDTKCDRHAECDCHAEAYA